MTARATTPTSAAPRSSPRSWLWKAQRGSAACAFFVSACAVVASACNLGRADTTPDPPVYATPIITDALVECDPERPRWSFDVWTTAWTGNGQVLLSADGLYIERHAIYSVSAEADGSTDHLSLDLAMVSDWRDVQEGSTTVFNCDEPALEGVLRVYVRGGDAVADCVAFGPDPTSWVAWEPSSACAEVLEPEDTGA